MTEAQKQRALAWLSEQFDGVRESGGANKGAFVERFQRAVDGKAQGEPWCASFVQYCLAEVDDLVHSLEGGAQKHSLPMTESTQEMWNKATPSKKMLGPDIGLVAVWRSNSNPALGHCGIVIAVKSGVIVTVEGNTGTGDQREGDGVCVKGRSGGQIPGMTLLGYLRPWGV